MSTKTSVSRLIEHHADTLRDANTQKVQPSDLIMQFGVPTLLSVVLTWPLGVRLIDAGQVIGGVAILAGFSFALMIWVFQLRLSAASDPRVGDNHQTLELLRQLFYNVAYSTVIGLTATVVALCGSAFSASWSVANGLAAAIWSGAVVWLLAHYLLVLLMCIKRLEAAFRRISR